MAVYTPLMNLYLPSRLDDQIHVDESLAQNFAAIEAIAGPALRKGNKAYNSILERFEELEELIESKKDGINILNFGAKGDGVTDDTPAFQAAIDYVEELGGGQIYLPYKNYLINGSVELVSNVEFFAEIGTKISKNASVYDSYLFTVGRTKGKPGYGGGARNIMFNNIQFVGIAESVNVRTAVSITFNHAQEVKFINCKFIDVITNGHALDLCGCDDVLILKCDFIGAFALPGREYVEAIQIDSSTSGSLSSQFSNYDSLPTKDVVVKFCKFLPSRRANGTVKNYAPNPIGNHGFTGDKFYEGIIFEDNYIEDGWKKTNGNWRSWIHFYGLKSSSISRNKFVNTQDDMDAGVIGLYTSSGGRYDPITGESGTGVPLPIKDVKINDNIFEGFKHSVDGASTLIRVYGSTFDSVVYRVENIQVENNILIGSGEIGSEGAGANLIQINNFIDVSVKNNKAKLGARLLSIYSGWGADIVDNKADGMSDGVIFASTCDNGKINGNVGANVRRPLEIQECKKIQVKDNQFDSVKQTGVDDHACKFRNIEGGIIQGNYVKNVGATKKGFYVYDTDLGEAKDIRMYDNLAVGFETDVFTSGTISNYKYRE